MGAALIFLKQRSVHADGNARLRGVGKGGGTEPAFKKWVGDTALTQKPWVWMHLILHRYQVNSASQTGDKL